MKKISPEKAAAAAERFARAAETFPEKATPKKRRRRQPGSKRKSHIVREIERRGLGCFVCGAKQGPWERAGRNRFGPWALCSICFITNRSKRQ